MASVNPEIYYDNPIENSYVYESLEQMVLNFESMYCGDGTQLGLTPRDKIIFWFKKGMQKFSISALQEKKVVELSLNETLDVILPPDYLNYDKIYWVNEGTGELMLLAKNPNIPLGTSYLQDNNAQILFDDKGYILEGTTIFDNINDNIKSAEVLACGTSGCSSCIYYNSGCPNPKGKLMGTSMSTTGHFNIDTRQSRIHFSSDNLTRLIMLSYISDGLEYENESDIKINKMCEEALYDFVNWKLLCLRPKSDVAQYEKNYAEKTFMASFNRAKIKMMDINVGDIIRLLR